MKSKCLDPVAIQAFLDGELPVLELEAAAAHVASCPMCGEAARELEAEIFSIGQAFEPELTLAVPTARLRARVNAAIDELPLKSAGGHETISLFGRIRAWGSSLTPQMAFGLASAVLAMTLIGWLAISSARSNRAPSGSIVAAINLKPDGDLPAWDQPPSPPLAPPPATEISTVGRHPLRNESRISQGAALSPSPLPGESAYMDTIAQMDHSLAQRDDLAVQPTLKADVERNLAVLDQAITTSQVQARRNPKDPNAAAFLYAAYQNKVEFLRTVSDQAQLYAALR